MRKQFDGLAGLVRTGMHHDPRSGDMFVFCNKRYDMMKILFYDQQGFCLLAKRREKGTFSWLEATSGGPVQISAAELTALMQGASMVKAA